MRARRLEYCTLHVQRVRRRRTRRGRIAAGGCEWDFVRAGWFKFAPDPDPARLAGEG